MTPNSDNHHNTNKARGHLTRADRYIGIGNGIEADRSLRLSTAASLLSIAESLDTLVELAEPLTTIQPLAPMNIRAV